MLHLDHRSSNRRPQFLKTPFHLKVDGGIRQQTKAGASQEETYIAKLTDAQVAGYFNQNLTGSPFSLDIVVQRQDCILISYSISLANGFGSPRVLDKNWHRGHTGHILALTTHPSLPLVASVSCDQDAIEEVKINELMIFWITSSAFTNESKMIPSGILRSDTENGVIESLHWLPTPHFNPTPILLVVYTSGVVEAYGWTEVSSPGIVHSPKNRTLDNESGLPLHFPWTYYEYESGESGLEYEVEVMPDPQYGVGLELEKVDNKIIVSQFKRALDGTSERKLPAELTHQISVRDELVAINSAPVVQEDLGVVSEMMANGSDAKTVSLRFRSSGWNRTRKSISYAIEPPVESKTSFSSRDSSTSADDDNHLSSNSSNSVKSDMDSVTDDLVSNDIISHLTSEITGGKHSNTETEQSSKALSSYGGWSEIGSSILQSSLSSCAVAPVYDDEGGFVPGTVIIFGSGSNTHNICAWKGEYSSSHGKFSLQPLVITNDSILNKNDITCIGVERDFRQRAFSTSIFTSNKEKFALNTLVYIGDKQGHIQHWRCGIHAEVAVFSSICSSTLPSKYLSPPPTLKTNTFYPRGRTKEITTDSTVNSVQHIEVDDPNRVAVLYTLIPDTVFIWEGESGLGVLRYEDAIRSDNQGLVQGFCWCKGHVEFNVDTLAIHFESGICIYNFDVFYQKWVVVGNIISTDFPLFECSRDCSSLLIACGERPDVTPGKEDKECCSNALNYSLNEMPVILGKWDTPRFSLQRTGSKPKHKHLKNLPVWHPYVILTTLFGMHARVGEKDTYLIDDNPTYEFSRAFNDGVQMLKLFAKVLNDEASAQMSSSNGVLIYLSERVAHDTSFKRHVGRAHSIGRFSTAVHPSASSNRAEDLFASYDPFAKTHAPTSGFSRESKSLSLEAAERDSILDAIDSFLDKKHVPKNVMLLLKGFHYNTLMELKILIEFIGKIQNLNFSLDESAIDLPGKRFYAMHLFSTTCHETLQDMQSESRSKPELESLASNLAQIPSSGILWAYHSESEEFLIDRCVSDQPTWEKLRPLWIGLWVTSDAKLRDLIERIAKTKFAKFRNAFDVSLFYIALGKKQILSALCKVCKDDRSKKLSAFLEHDFSQERWKTAAIKNAYSLLSKKQYEYAAAFFLLPSPPNLREASRIIMNRLNDPSLGVVISRLVESRISTSPQMDYNEDLFSRKSSSFGQITRALLEEDLLPYFHTLNDHWLESTTLMCLNKPSEAVNKLSMTSFAISPPNYGNDEADSTHHGRTTSSSILNFFVDITSLPLYLQYIYSKSNERASSATSLNSSDTFYTNGHAHGKKKSSSLQLISSTEIEQAYAFSAYVCKRSGLTDTSIVDMLQARHLVNLHANRYIQSKNQNLETPLHINTANEDSAFFRDTPVPEIHPSIFDTDVVKTHRYTSKQSRSRDDACSLLKNGSKSSTEDIQTDESLQATGTQIDCRRWSSSAFVGRLIGTKVARELISHFRFCINEELTNSNPKNNIQSPRSKMISHKQYLDEVCSPICDQFKVEKQYILEAALSVMQPHAQEHLIECSFILYELGKTSTMEEWIHFVTLSLLHSCSTFASIKFSMDHFYDWKIRTTQLCYLMKLDGDNALYISNSIIGVMAIAVRLGCFVLAWITGRSELLKDTILSPFLTQIDAIEDKDFHTLSRTSYASSIEILRSLLPIDSSRVFQRSDSSCSVENFGYVFLENNFMSLNLYSKRAQDQEETSIHSSKQPTAKLDLLILRKFYTTILLVQLLRTLFSRAQLLCSRVRRNLFDEVETDSISSVLFPPRKLWKNWMKFPLEGIQKWYQSLELHLNSEIDHIGKEEKCICGFYGIMDYYHRKTSRESLSRPYGYDDAEPTALIRTSSFSVVTTQNYHNDMEDVSLHSLLNVDRSMHFNMIKHINIDYILMLMKHPQTGVKLTTQHFRAEPRVYIVCFTWKDASKWFVKHDIFTSRKEEIQFLRRCCEQKRLRQVDIVSSNQQLAHSSSILKTDSSEFVQANFSFVFVDPWEVDAERNLLLYAFGNKVPGTFNLGWDRLTHSSCRSTDELMKAILQDPQLLQMRTLTGGDGWIVNAVIQSNVDGVYTFVNDQMRKLTDIGVESEKPFLREIFNKVQKNIIFKQLGLPHRFIGVVKVQLLEARNLISTMMLMNWCNPYAFFSLSNSDRIEHSSTSWRLTTYRSRVGTGGSHPKWGIPMVDDFVFRYAIPIHTPHQDTSTQEYFKGSDSHFNFFEELYHGPRTLLHFSLYDKSKFMAHIFLGKGKVSLMDLTRKHPLDQWIPLEGVSSGELHLRIKLEFQVVSSV